MDAHGLVALVTGGARGLGVEIGRQLTDSGATVVLGARDPAVGARVADELGVDHVLLDVDDEAGVGEAAAIVAARHGGIDILINNAAIMYDTWARAVDVDLADTHRALETNLFGAWRTAQACVPHLRASAHGRLVNVSSESGSLASMGAGTPSYSVGKAALNALTCILAAELRADGVLVNAVCPGWTATDMGGGGRPVPEGAAGVVWAALLDDDGPTGGFFRDGRPVPW